MPVSRFAVPLALIFVAVPLHAQTAPSALSPRDGLDLSGNVRLRAEAIEGQARAGFNDSDQLINSRIQLRLSWRKGPVELVGELHDSRAWGANAGTPLSSNEVNTLEPVQAFVRGNLGDVLGDGTRTTVQAGRFVMELGSRRLVANDDYRNTTNGFTGIRADISAPGGVSATAIYVLPQVRLPSDAAALRRHAVELDRASFAAVLWGGVLARQRRGSRQLAEIIYLHFGERDTTALATRDRSLNTLSGRWQMQPAPDRFDGGVEAIYQWGEETASTAASATIQPASATFLRAHAGYTFSGGWKPHIQAEIDRASGDGPGPTFGRFDTLFGMRRADLAPSGLFNAIARANLLSPGVRVEVAPSPRLDAFIGYRAYWLADRRDAFASTGVRDASGQSGNFAGHQLDARLRWWIVPQHMRAEIDAVYLARGRFLETAPNGRVGDTRYMSFNLSWLF